MKLRTQDAQPLYKQIVQAIQHSIQSGEYPEGSRLPSEQELSELFHVSRITVRTAWALPQKLTALRFKSRPAMRWSACADSAMQIQFLYPWRKTAFPCAIPFCWERI